MRFMATICIISIVVVSGCATTSTRTGNTQIQQLQSKVLELEKELEIKNEKIGYLESQLTDTKGNATAESNVKKVQKSTVTMSARDIQRALKKAGYYSGAIDGKIGTLSEKAIKKFQEANGLKADGIVGRQTRLKLNEYLY